MNFLHNKVGNEIGIIYAIESLTSWVKRVALIWFQPLSPWPHGGGPSQTSFLKW